MVDTRYTFLLPAYKACFLRDALKSILNQTLGSYKIIVSDDASPEPLQAIVNSFDDDRISFHRNANNLGAARLVQHWNLLLENCDSDYVIVASDDDLYHPRFLEIIDALTHDFPEAEFIRARACIIDQNGETLKTEDNGPEWMSQEGLLDVLINPDSVLCIGNCVFKTSALKDAGGFVSFPLGWKSDSATQILLSQKGVPCSNEILFSFRMSGFNISSGVERNREKDCNKLNALIAFDEWMTHFIPGNVLERYRRPLRNRLEGEARSYLWTLSISGFLRLYRKLCREGWFLSSRNKVSFLLCWFRFHHA